MHLLILAASEGGFNPLDLAGGGNVLWTVVIFCVALPFMWKVVMGPVTRALGERDDAAKQAIVAAEKASADAEKARAEVEVRLGEAQAEASKLLSQARERAELRERELFEQAKQESKTMIENAQKAIQAEKDKALSDIRNRVVELSLHAAGQVLKRKVDGEDDRRLVSELIGTTKDAKA